MLITGLYKVDEVAAVYSHVDRMVNAGLHAGARGGVHR